MNANEATLLYVDEFSRMAEAYDRNVVPRFEAIAQEVLRLANPKAGELVLDLGTGTGLLACLVAPLVRPQGVVAIDLADGAISVASYRAGNAGIRPTSAKGLRPPGSTGRKRRRNRSRSTSEIWTSC